MDERRAGWDAFEPTTAALPALPTTPCALRTSIELNAGSSFSVNQSTTSFGDCATELRQRIWRGGLLGRRGYAAVADDRKWVVSRDRGDRRERGPQHGVHGDQNDRHSAQKGPCAPRILFFRPSKPA